jgi:hypothetical protein
MEHGNGVSGMTRADAIRVLTDYRMELNTAMDGDELNPVLSALDTAIAVMAHHGDALYAQVAELHKEAHCD